MQNGHADAGVLVADRWAALVSMVSSLAASACWRVKTASTAVCGAWGALRRIKSNVGYLGSRACGSPLRRSWHLPQSPPHLLELATGSCYSYLHTVQQLSATCFTGISGQFQSASHETMRSEDSDLRCVLTIRHDLLELPRTPPNHESTRQPGQSP